MSIPRTEMTFLCVSFIAWLGAAALADDAPISDPETSAAIKVLARRVGTWDDQITIKPCKWVPTGSRTTATSVFTMTHGGRFLRGESEGVREQDGQKHSEKLTIIATYSVQRKAYLSWAFFAVSGDGTDYWGGGETPAVGQWDEKTKTQSFETIDKEKGLAGSGSAHWIDDDHIEWGQVIKDDNGEVVFQQTGKSTRRKAK
jgi:hypothetical protein